MNDIAATRSVAITGELENLLLFRRMTAVESLGRLFEFDVHLLSREEKIEPRDVLGKSLTIQLELQDGGVRYFNGVISRFAQTAEIAGGGEFAQYRAFLRPWLWFLTRSSDCRIFQNLTIVDIIKKIFDDAGYSDYTTELVADYKEWEYCVQYRETDFNFVSRLMEQEGIYYFFRHEEDKHTLVLCDSPTSHRTGVYDTVPFSRRRAADAPAGDCIERWTLTHRILPETFALEDFDFLRPKRIRDTASEPDHYVHTGAEIYDYPGEFVRTKEERALEQETKAELERYVNVRKDEMHHQYERFQGAGTVRGIETGTLFRLTDHPRWDAEPEFLVTNTTYELASDAHTTTPGGGAEDICRCRFLAIPSTQVFRPQRLTPKPVVHGPQTAIVTGPSGEEIYTDKYGRVKVQFHWDREGGEDENSSCWIRVAQIWAGKNWGGMFIPRIGQEVIVDFLEGDPDHPIITGRVYNEAHLPPYELPGEATKSTIKSDSSKGGGGFNEIRFEDKAGEEQIYVHAQRNRDIEVEEDETHLVKHDRTKTIENDESIEIGNNRTAEIGTDDTLNVGANLLIDAGQKITLQTGASKIIMESSGTITIEGVQISIKGNGTVTIEAGGQLEAKASGSTTIRGAVVQIN